MSSVYGQTLLDDMVQRQGLPMPLVKQAAQEILAVIREGLISDGVVNVSNFGTFRLKLAAARQGFNPQTKERITIPAHQRVIFSPCKALRDLIQPVHHPVIPIEPDVTPQRTAAMSTPIASAGPLATKRIMPPPQSIAEKPETSEPPPPGPTTVTPERRVTPDRRHHAEQGETETTEAPHQPHTTKQNAPDVASRLDAFTDSANAIALEAEEETDTTGRAKKGLYLGAAALLVIAAVTASLMYDSSPKELPAAVINTPSTDSRPASTPLATDTLLPETQVTVAAPATVEAETSANEEVDNSTLYTEMADTQPEAPLANVAVTGEETAAETVSEAPPPAQAIETTAETTTEQAPPAITKPVAIATDKPTTFFFTEQTHKITNGESLWRLARQHYKNPLLWPHIYQANAALIDNPDSLRQGRTIILPSLQGTADNLTKTDRRNIAEGYYLTYLYYKNTGNKDAFFALLEAKRYDNKVVEEHRSLLRLSKVEEIMLGHQETMPF